MWLRQSVISQRQVEKYVLDEQVYVSMSRQYSSIEVYWHAPIWGPI